MLKESSENIEGTIARVKIQNFNDSAIKKFKP